MRHRLLIVLACLLCALTLALTGLDSGRSAITITNAASTTITDCPTVPDIGCKDQAFPLNPSKSDFAPTGEKPQSKLWYNDGRWWASMLNTADNHYYIFYLNGQTWVKTNTPLDPRAQTQADCLWDSANHKLYVVSGAGVIYSGVDLNAQLFRYSYNAANPPETAYTLDSGFPATIRTGGAETIVLDKDSQGKLWVTYTQNNQVWVNHSTSADNLWGTAINPTMPASLTSGTTVGPDDISSLVAFNGKIGVIWSNQTDSTFYYAIHVDGDGDSAWQSGIILRQSGIADDHINLKSVQTDGGGNIFAVVKTSLDGGGVNDPRMLVLRRNPAGAWSSTVFIHEKEGTTQTPYTRAILLIDSANHRLYVFATTNDSGGTIVYKLSSDYTAGTLSFPTGFGTNFIRIGGLGAINNATSTKQSVDGTSGIVVLASDGTFRFYVHNVILLTNPPTTPTPTQLPNTPTRTPSPTATPHLDTHLYLPLLLR